jgi:hypothetical protein
VTNFAKYDRDLEAETNFLPPGVSSMLAAFLAKYKYKIFEEKKGTE